MRLILFFLLCLTLGACHESKIHNETNSIVRLSGQIENASDSLLVLRNNFWEVLDTIVLENGSFQYVETLSSRYYYLLNGQGTIKVYLEPGMDLKMQVERESVTFTGAGENENNYLLSKNELTNSFPIKRIAYTEYAKQDEESFLAQADSIHEEYISHFESFKNLNSSFSSLERESIDINHGVRLAQYQGMKRGVDDNPDFVVSKNYPNPFAGIDLNNPELLKTYRYVDLINSFVGREVKKMQKDSVVDEFFIGFQYYLAQSDLAPEIRDRLGLDNSDFGFTYTKDRDKYYQTYMGFVQDEAYKKEFQKRYSKLLQERGNPSPDFEFVDVNGKTYTLDDFKGKYIYIDLWASWCSPCLKQIPYLQKLEKQYSEKINFVSIAWSDTKKNWKEAIDQKGLTGFHLFAEDSKDDFFTFYELNGIPRFILLDKEGNIIESKAKQPSNEELKKQLAELE